MSEQSTTLDKRPTRLFEVNGVKVYIQDKTDEFILAMSIKQEETPAEKLNHVMEWFFKQVPQNEQAVLDYVFSNGDLLTAYKQKGNYYGIGEVWHWTVSYGEKAENYFDDGKPAYMSCASQHFPVGKWMEVWVCFVNRARSEDPAHYDPKVPKYKLDQIKTIQTGELCYESHYNYLHAMLDPVWTRVFGKSAEDMACGGIVGAHGDKCYSYRDEWAKQGISFPRGALIFLLSYTKERGDYPRHKVSEWVIENYPKYLPIIEQAEAEVIERDFGAC